MERLGSLVEANPDMQILVGRKKSGWFDEIMAVKKCRARLYHLMQSPPWVQVRRRKHASDHAPVWIELGKQPGKGRGRKKAATGKKTTTRIAS